MVNKPVRLAYDIRELDIIENILSKTWNLELFYRLQAQNFYYILHDLNKGINQCFKNPHKKILCISECICNECSTSTAEQIWLTFFLIILIGPYFLGKVSTSSRVNRLQNPTLKNVFLSVALVRCYAKHPIRCVSLNFVCALQVIFICDV